MREIISEEEIKTLTFHEFFALRGVLSVEERRREREGMYDVGRAEVIRDLRESGVFEDPAPLPDDLADPGEYMPWSTPIPGDWSTVYLWDDMVSHQGRVYQSINDHLNYREPNAESVEQSAWRDLTDDLEAFKANIEYERTLASEPESEPEPGSAPAA